MIRNLKILGLALGAMLAFGALTAAGASAQTNGVLTSDGPVTLTGTETGGPQDNRFTAFETIVDCESTYTGHKYNATPHQFLESGATTITITPHYTNCDNGKVVDMNGCDFVFHIGETTPADSLHTYGVTADVVCPAGASILITRGSGEPCDVTVPAQTGLSGPHLTHTTETKKAIGDIDLKGTFTNITANACHGFLHTNEAQLHVDLTIRGHNEAGEPTKVTITH